MIKEIPMLFSQRMVEAIDEEQKTKTRRTRGLDQLNCFSDRWSFIGKIGHPVWGECFRFRNREIRELELVDIKCPYGKIGDVIWVRETSEKCKKGYRYRAGNISSIAITGKWTPGIHMPKEAARFWLEITNITVERLHDITEADSVREGVQLVSTHNQWYNYLHAKNALPCHMWVRGARKSFETLWIKINGEASWRYNPWVWVIEFKKINR